MNRSSSLNKPNKLSFRARQLDVSKPMPIYMAEDLSDLAETTEIKRSVPQMPTGMEKDEECEHHLQRAIVTGTVIPTPEVNELDNLNLYHRTYPGGYQMPKQLIRMHPFALEQEHPEYDADSEDEEWLNVHGKALNIDIDKFEAIIDKLDKNSNFSVITLPESKILLKESDDIVTAVYDYWLSKRLRLQHSLIPTVKTEAGLGPANDPYIAFRRRKDKMQTRKNRKNDETSYEKMLKLKKDLSYAYQLFQRVKAREDLKLQLAKLHMEIYQKRFEVRDFSGSLLNEVKHLKRPQLYGSTFTPITANQPLAWSPKPKELKKLPLKSSTYYLDDGSPKKEKRHYKKRKRNRIQNGFDSSVIVSSDEEKSESSSPGLITEENPFTFKRQKNCSYLAPTNDDLPWDYEIDEVFGNENRRFYAAYVTIPKLRSVGFARRRLGRGGRIVLDRAGVNLDDVWSSLDYTIKDSGPRAEFTKYKPKSPSTSSSDETDDAFYESDDSTASLKPLIEVENLLVPSTDNKTSLEVDINNPLKNEATYAILDRIASYVESSKETQNAKDVTSSGGSILERWTKSKRNRVKAPKQTSTNFSLKGPDAETIGCSTFRTVSENYFEGAFNFKNPETQYSSLTEVSAEKSLSQLLMNDCEPLSIRELLLWKS